MAGLKKIIFISFVMCSFFASAHSMLKFSFPADGQQINIAPEILALTFHKPVKLVKLEIFDINGEQVKFAFMLSPRESEYFEIPLPLIEPSSYKVIWSAVSEEAKTINGEFSFQYKLYQSAEKAL